MDPSPQKTRSWTQTWREIKLSRLEKNNLANFQENCDYLEKILNVIIVEFGINKKQIKTDDKLSPHTKNLIKKRMEIRGKITLSVKEQRVISPAPTLRFWVFQYWKS